MRKAARISARQSGESMGGIDYELPKVQKVLGKINKAKTRWAYNATLILE